MSDRDYEIRELLSIILNLSDSKIVPIMIEITTGPSINFNIDNIDYMIIHLWNRLRILNKKMR